MYSQRQILYLSGSITAQQSREGKLFLIHGTCLLVDLSNANGEERGTRFLLRHLHRVQDDSNYIGDCNVEEDQEIRSNKEQKGKE